MLQRYMPTSFRLWSVRTQIILGFGVILGLTLLIVLVNFFALRNLQAGIQATVEEAVRLREIGLETENQFLLARKEEREFLENWRGLGFEEARMRHATANEAHIERAQALVDDLNQLLSQSTAYGFEGLEEEIAELGSLLAEYDRAFSATVQQVGERSRAGGLDRQLAITLDELETAADSLPESGELIRAITQMAASEQAYFNTGAQQHIDQLRLLDDRARALLNTTSTVRWAWSPLARPLVLDMLDAHGAVFEDLQLLENEVAINTLIFQEVTGEISDLASLVVEQGAESIDAARIDLERAVNNSTAIAIAAGIITMGVGVLTALLLAQRIIGPVTALNAAAQEIGRGNLSHRVNVTGRDEFAVLGRTFNQMTGQLRTLVGSLEQAVADRTRALKTSFEISRQLSTILDQSRLVKEVVEQVRQAFDYYHTHIYLWDENTASLIMVGGTGVAGRAMLASRHRLSQGQGLVGQAAATAAVVLAPDVRTNPNWLPNPLLPETRSEIAVPITLGDRVLGVLDVQHNVRGGLDDEDAELLQSIANQVAVALQNAAQFEEAQEKVEREGLVNTINQQIQRAATVQSVLQVAAKEIGRALGGRRTPVQLNLEGLRTNGDRDGNG